MQCILKTQILFNHPLQQTVGHQGAYTFENSVPSCSAIRRARKHLRTRSLFVGISEVTTLTFVRKEGEKADLEETE